MKTSNEKPILFSAPMVRAILEGRKTMTRRVVKPQPESDQDDGHAGLIQDCPYGQPGDRLWVRETFSTDGCACYEPCFCPSVWYKADDLSEDKELQPKWCPSIFMPRWASRIILEVTGVRVERLQEITNAGALAEGIEPSGVPRTYVGDFAALWDSLNAKRGYGWDTNPWVWVIGFYPPNCQRMKSLAELANQPPPEK
jgi:hypothetical protein